MFARNAMLYMHEVLDAAVSLDWKRHAAGGTITEPVRR